MQEFENQISTSLKIDADSFQRKVGHIALAESSQTSTVTKDPRFYYEPLLYHQEKIDLSRTVAGKKVSYPLWISSMTGGTEIAKNINQNLALTAKEFGLGMGLGSLRPLLNSNSRIADFEVRKYLGPDLPLMGNIGIAQIEELMDHSKLHLIDELCKNLELDGLFIHINLLQEWFQPNGDVVLRSPVELLKIALDKIKAPIFIKEVGHGFGPKSLAQLFDLPIRGIEFGAFGGTNFSLIEEKRKSEKDLTHPLIYVGHSYDEMMDSLINLYLNRPDIQNKINESTLIVSGGIRNFLDGYFAIEKMSGVNSVLYAHAKEFIIRAHSKELLNTFVTQELKGLDMAHRVLKYNPQWK